MPVNGKGAQLGFSHSHENVKTLQIVNTWKASKEFERLVLDRRLGEVRRRRRRRRRRFCF